MGLSAPPAANGGTEKTEFDILFEQMEADPAVMPPAPDPAMVAVDGEWLYPTPEMLKDRERETTSIPFYTLQAKLVVLHPNLIDPATGSISGFDWEVAGRLIRDGVARNDTALELLGLDQAELDEIFGIA